MKKSDLEIFDVVKLRDGKVLMVLPNDMSPDGLATYSLGTIGCHYYISRYNDDLTFGNRKKYEDDIVAVHKSRRNKYDAIKKLFVDLETNFDWDWKCQDPKEMTMEELEKVLGYPVKIVKEKEQ